MVRSKREQKHKGFILIESVMAIVLVAIISVVVGAYIVQAFNSYIFVKSQKDMTFTDRTAMFQMMKEIKTIPNTGNIITYTAGQYSFKDSGNNTITYSQSGNNLLRNTDVMARNLKSPNGLVFAYYDNNGTAVVTSSAISVIKATISAVNGNNKFTIESGAHLRIK